MEQLHQTDALPYSLQSSKMSLQVKDNTFVMDGIAQPKHSLYRGLEHVLGSFNPSLGAQDAIGEYTSEVFVAKRPYVMVPVSGYLGYKGTSLSLVGESNDKVVDVKPKGPALNKQNEWREVLVKAPDKKYRIVAKDESSRLWLAFAAPRSVGRLSYLVSRIIRRGDKIWFYGLVLLVIAFRSQIVQLVALKETRSTNA